VVVVKLVSIRAEVLRSKAQQCISIRNEFMSKPAARKSDMTAHGKPATPGLGSTNVFIGKKNAWRTISDTHLCPLSTPTPHGPEKCYLGSTTVFINNKMACRLGDILQGAGPQILLLQESPLYSLEMSDLEWQN